MSANFFLSLLLSLLLGLAFSAAADPARTPDGLEYCTVCHGSQLMGNINIRAPRLSDLPDWYIDKQLLAFKQGWRGNHAQDIAGIEMRPMVSELADAKLKQAASWASQTESPRPVPTFTADAKAGERVYQTCLTCHGMKAQGNPALNAPALVGLNDWYLVTQLKHFRDGIRGNHPDDIQGAQMRAAMNLIKDEQDFVNVAAYINELGINQPGINQPAQP
jgi:cytochrome c oxidase subunit 2